MRKKYIAEHVMKRDDMFYYVRHIPIDLIEHSGTVIDYLSPN